MKVFISHSSRDKWAARRISEDLNSEGATTFLDEKDIYTGQSIDDSIKKHMKECDDFLILISPASLKSEWVLIELGGAIALEKNIIPILLYVGANEIPQIINLRLARDINDIDQYYSEIKNKVSGAPLKKKKTKKSLSKLKAGDVVKITAEVPEDIWKGSYLVDWENGMNKYLGRETTINRKVNEGMYVLDIDTENQGGFVYAEDWLTKI